MDSGLLLLILIFTIVFLIFCVGAYFHMCSQDYSTVRCDTLPTRTASEVDPPKPIGKLTFVNRAGFTGNYYMQKCECANQFKKRCTLCQGPTFVDDYVLGDRKDFSGHGGDIGFETPPIAEGDPTKGFFGKGNNVIN